MEDKMSYQIREDLIIRFHVSQVREKTSFLDYLENVPKQRKKQVQNLNVGACLPMLQGRKKKKKISVVGIDWSRMRVAVSGTEGWGLKDSARTWVFTQKWKAKEGFWVEECDDLTLKRSYLEHKNVPLKLPKTHKPCTCFYYNLCFNLLILY